MNNIVKSLLLVGVAILITGCKLTVHVGDGGDVHSQYGDRDCSEGSNCVFEVTDTSFHEVFTATPLPGYEFVKWQAGDGFLCGDSHIPTCTTSTVGLAGDAGAESFIASDKVLRIKPIFQRDTRSALVFVDATDKIIGVPYNTTNDASYMDNATVFVKVDGYRGAYVMYFDRAAQAFTPGGELQYTDATCGNDGGQAYMVVTNPLRPTMPVAKDLSGNYFIPEPGVLPERHTMSSRARTSTCQALPASANNVVPAVPVEFSVEFPVRLEFR